MRGGSVVLRLQREGHHIFVDELTRFAEEHHDHRLTPVIDRLTEPVRVAVVGRPGVGCRTVAAALTAAGHCVVPPRRGGDVTVLVIAEALKPEERAAMAGEPPALIVLNKADLLGAADGGPIATAYRRAVQCRRSTGVPTVPLVGLLAVAELDPELRSALQILITDPADLSSVDAFLSTGHRLPAIVRARLLATLDRFGIAHAVLALAGGADPATVPALLRRASDIDRVSGHLTAATAPVRYRRLCSAINELRCLAIEFGDDVLSAFLAADATVLAVMAAAVHVVEAAGVEVDRGDDPDAHLRRAVHWRRYSRGPVTALHRNCGSDIVRGSLRLLGQAQRGQVHQ